MKALLDQLDALPPGDAVFDLDNTLLVGDIGEATLRRLQHRLPPKAACLSGRRTPGPPTRRWRHATGVVRVTWPPRLSPG